MLREAENTQSGTLAARLSKIFKGGKKMELLLYGAVILIVLVLYVVGLRRDRAKNSPTAESAQTSTAAAITETGIEEKLASVLSCIRGAGRVEVMVTYESSTELVPAMTTSTNNNASESSDGSKTNSSSQTTESTQPATVTGANGDTPIVLMEKQPVVRGVIVVAEGAADIRVKLDLQRAVQAVLNIPLSKIEVFELSTLGME